MTDLHKSLLSRERGLKSGRYQIMTDLHKSLLSRERGLKFVPKPLIPDQVMSLLSRERGLKFKKQTGDNAHVCRSSHGSVD